MSKNPCGLDYCPYMDIVGDFAICTSCSWASFEDEKDVEESEVSELIKGLRKLGNQWKHNDVAGYHLIMDACYTIEVLSAKLARYNLGYGEWIPVSERLPENIGRYIVTLKDYWAITVKVAVYGVMPHDTHNKKVFWLYDSCYDDLDITEDVVAWMPLPEPYREDGEE